jgi:hypothetical protein
MERDQWPSGDPELRDPTQRPRGPSNEPSDVGSDPWRDLGDGPPPAWRDAAPDPFAPIDPNAPVSGHQPVREPSASPAESPEHDWSAAQGRIYPLLRPSGTTGVAVADLDAAALAAEGMKSHAQPLVDEGPAGLAVVYAIASGRFDVIVNADHLLSWGVEPSAVQDAAIANLTAWSARAPWSDERSDQRRLLSSQSGEGWDAARVLLPDVRDHLARELGADGRVLVGLPERHLLVAATLRADDLEFVALFAEFVIEQSGAADEPIERRLFELVGGSLMPFAG